MGTLFEQRPQAQIWSKLIEKRIAHQIANNKMIVLSTEKSHMGPKLWGFKYKLLDAYRVIALRSIGTKGSGPRLENFPFHNIQI